MVAPQSGLQADQSTIQIILTSAAIPNCVPVLFSVHVHFGDLRPQRVEMHARTLPPSGSYSDYIHLIGYGEFVRQLASGSYITLGRERFQGEATVMQLQTGGNYALHILLPTLNEFVSQTAQALVDARPPSSSEEEDDASMLQTSVKVCPTMPLDGILSRMYDTRNPSNHSLQEFVMPLPATIGEAMRHTRILRLFPSWQELCDILTARGDHENQPVVLHTYAIRGRHVGERTTQVQVSNQFIVLRAIQHLWQDIIGDDSFQIFVLSPQPAELPPGSIGLLVEIPTLEIDIDFYAPVLLAVLSHAPTHTDHDYVVATDYVPRRATLSDVFETARAGQHCQPRGQFRCVVDIQQRALIDPNEPLQIRSGNYIVVLVLPNAWFAHDFSTGLHGATAFAREAYTAIADPTDPFVIVTTNAIGEDNRYVGQRSFFLRQRLTTEANVLWNLVCNLWTDTISSDSLRIVHSPTPPQLPLESRSTFIAMERSRPGHIPLLVSFYRQTLDNVQPEIHDGTYAMQLRPPIRYADISSEVDAGPATQSALNSTQIWCEEAYFSCDERLPVEPGTHLLVYTPDEGGQTEENHEEEAATSDESMDLPDDRSSTLQRRSWTLWTIVVSWTAAAISTSPHEWHRSVISVVLQGTIYFALSPLNWQSHVSDRWCSVNLMVGDAIRCRTSEDLYWTNDTQRADRRDLPLVDLSCSSRICTRPPRNDEVQVPATLDRCRHETVRRPILFEAASHGGSSDGCGLTSRPSGISPKRDAIYFNSFDGGRKLLGRCSGQPCVYLMWATFFFLHPCHQLSPPGNGRPISLVNLLRRDGGGSNHTSPAGIHRR